MPVSEELLTNFINAIKSVVEEYRGPEINSNNLRRFVKKYIEQVASQETGQKYGSHLIYQQTFKDLNQFTLPREIGTIPIITFDLDRNLWKAEYFIPHRMFRYGNNTTVQHKGWKPEVLPDATYRGRALDATHMNKYLFGPNLSDTFKIVNLNGDIILHKNQIKELVARRNNTDVKRGFGIVLLDNEHVALVPYRYVADKYAQTFYSFEFETNAASFDLQRRLLEQYTEEVHNAFLQKKGFTPPWRELRLNAPRAYLDSSVPGPHPLELVNTGFTLPTALFFTYHWVDVIRDYIHPEFRNNPDRRCGMHISATVRTLPHTLLTNYFYGLRLFDTILFRPGKRRQSTEYLTAIGNGRGLFRFFTTPRLEIRYPQPRLDKKYLLNQFIISAKYVCDINFLSSNIHFTRNSGVYPSYSSFDSPKVTREASNVAKEFFQEYMRSILGLSPEEELIFTELKKYCSR